MRWDTRWGLKNTLLDISPVFRIINARSNIRNDGINIPKVMQKRANDLNRYKVRYQWIIGWDTWWSLKIALSDIAVGVCIVNAPSNTWNGDPNSVQMTQKQLNDPERYEVRYQWTYRERDMMNPENHEFGHSGCNLYWGRVLKHWKWRLHSL